MTNTCAALNLEDLTIVNGGTFTSNKFPEWAYQRAGFRTDFHFFAKDEFIMNGVTFHEDQANAMMAQMGWEIRTEKVVTRRSTNMGGVVVPDRSITRIVIYHNGVEQRQNMI